MGGCHRTAPGLPTTLHGSIPQGVDCPLYVEVSHLPPIQVAQFPPPAGYYAPTQDYSGLGMGRTMIGGTRWKWIGHGWAPVSLPGSNCTCNNSSTTNNNHTSSFSGCSVILILIIVFLTSLLCGLAFKHWQLIKLNRELTSLEIDHVEPELPERNLTASFFEIIFLILGGFIIIVAVLRDICRRRSNL